MAAKSDPPPPYVLLFRGGPLDGNRLESPFDLDAIAFFRADGQPFCYDVTSEVEKLRANQVAYTLLELQPCPCQEAG